MRPAVVVRALVAVAAHSRALHAGMSGSVHGLVAAPARHATPLGCQHLPPLLPCPCCSFGERYLSSALFQTLREEAEAQTFDA